MKKILVTGGSGFIGKYVLDYLGDQGVNWDIKNGDDLFGISDIDRDEYSAIIHLAANKENPSQNVKMTAHMFEIAKFSGLKFVLASSAAVYEDLGYNSQRETDPIKGLSEYAFSKIGSELIVKQSPEKNWVILRYFNVYGKGGSGIINKAVEWSKNNQAWSINNSGHQIRDFIRVEEVAAITVTATLNSEWNGKTVNVGTGKPTSIVDLQSEFYGLTAQESNRKRDVGLHPIEIQRSCADNLLLRKLWGQPDDFLMPGIRRLLDDKT